ncbi:MAG: choice-of-anchor Q domain-containing protein [Pseudolysinimonas sp.]
MATPAMASTLTVMSNADSGAGSLRDTLSTAGSGDVIDFQAGITAINLTSTITIPVGVTIDGGGDVTIGRADVSDFTQLEFILSNTDQDITLRDITITGIPAGSGAGVTIAWGAGENPRNVTFDGLTVTGESSYIGAAYIERAEGTVVVRGSSFTDNVGTITGGLDIASVNGPSVTVSDTTFDGNSAANAGGGFSMSDSPDTDLTLSSVVFNDNHVTNGVGGAMYLDSLADVLIDGAGTTGNSKFTNNDASDSGGAIYARILDSLTIRDTTMNDNEAIGDRGGAIWADTIDGAVVIDGVDAARNDSVGNGGFLNLITAASIAVTNSVLSSNTSASGVGGAIFTYPDAATTLTVSGSTFSLNSAVFGGAVYMDQELPGIATISDSSFTNNTAHQGAAIRIDLAASLTVSRSIFSGNHDTEFGAFQIQEVNDGATVLFDSSTFSNNDDTDGGGISGLSLSVTSLLGELDILNSTFDDGGDDDASLYVDQINGAGVVYVASSTLRGPVALRIANVGDEDPRIENSILEATGPGLALETFSSDSGEVQVRYSILNTVLPGFAANVEGNQLSTDPLLGALQNNGGAGGMFTRLPNAGSPAINAGDPSFDPSFAPFDERGTGFPRVQGGRLDLGAVELQASLAATGSEIPWLPGALGVLALLAGAAALISARRPGTSTSL